MNICEAGSIPEPALFTINANNNGNKNFDKTAVASAG